ncbi:MAG: DUF6438 domain-containing protein [Pseudomonadota bacterium]|nr:DUF6438 domain-containing protein [Pseudomonadota bacterium]
MRRFGLALAFALAPLGGCATAAGGGSAPNAESLSYETGPCFGACPVYRVTVNADGTGLFEGRQHTAVQGERRFSLTAAQYRALLAHLEPLRPASGSANYSGEACEMTATDLPSAEVTWRMPGGEQRLYFYHGCDMEKNRPIAERLEAVPDLLPIGDMVRTDQ